MMKFLPLTFSVLIAKQIWELKGWQEVWLNILGGKIDNILIVRKLSLMQNCTLHFSHYDRIFQILSKTYEAFM